MQCLSIFVGMALHGVSRSVKKRCVRKTFGAGANILTYMLRQLQLNALPIPMNSATGLDLDTLDQSGDVLLCSSFSKTLAPGYRVGYIAPGHRYRRILSLKRATSLASTSLPAFAIAEFLKSSSYDRYLRAVCKSYGERIARMLQAIEEHFPYGTRISPPHGGFVLWCELPAKTDAIRVFKKALAAGITLAPGPLFSPQGEFKNFIRLNCSHPYTVKTERAMRLLGKIINEALSRFGDSKDY